MLRLKQIAGVFTSSVIYGVLLFVPAGTLDWPRAWVFLAGLLATSALVVFRIPKDLLDERYKPPIQRGQPLADRIVLIALIVTALACVAFIPLDVFRFRLLGSPGLPVAILGLALSFAGWWLAASALLENQFAALVVRHQQDRLQRVVDTGPYRVVRHPMYASAIPSGIGMALWLGSYAAAIAAIAPVALLAVRARFEEEFLRRELPGYEDYTRRTRFRMIPYVW
jgi:protein-S-isoprenylcysteine O-methyltransferase Ste14